MKKYRIKVLEGADGSKTYIPQYRQGIWNMIARVILFPITFPFAIPSILAYDNNYFWDRFQRTGEGWVVRKTEEEAMRIINEEKALELKRKMSAPIKLIHIKA